MRILLLKQQLLDRKLLIIYIKYKKNKYIYRLYIYIYVQSCSNYFQLMLASGWLRDRSQTETSWAKLGQAAPTAWNVPWLRQNLSWRAQCPTSCGAADGFASRSRSIQKQGKRRQVLNIAQHCLTHMPPACHLYKLSAWNHEMYAIKLRWTQHIFV
jgi:hypothetical protein